MRYAKRNIQNFYSIVVLLFNEIGDCLDQLFGTASQLGSPIILDLDGDGAETINDVSNPYSL